MISVPRLYAIVDASCFSTTEELAACAEELAAGGCTLLQYRNKNGNARVMLQQARELKRLVGGKVKLIMNDRADLCLAAEFDGVHVGQEDLSPESVRRIIGPDRWLGVSTHNRRATAGSRSNFSRLSCHRSCLFYLEQRETGPGGGPRRRAPGAAVDEKAAGRHRGITRANAASVIEAGADSVAVISDLIREPRKSAEEFFRILR